MCSYPNMRQIIQFFYSHLKPSLMLSGLSQTHCIAKFNLELMILLPQIPNGKLAGKNHHTQLEI